MKESQSNRWFHRATRAFFLILTVCMLFGAIRSPNLDISILSPKAVAAMLLIAMPVFAVMLIPRLREAALSLVKRALSFVKAHVRIFALCYVAAIALYQIMLILAIRTSPGFDPGVMQVSIPESLANMPSWVDTYLSMYPNNHLYYLVLYFLSSITGYPSQMLFDVFNMLCIDISLVLTACAAGREFGRNYSYATLFFGGLLIGFSPIVLVAYTDTIVLPFVSAGLLALTFCHAEAPLSRQILMGLLLGIIAALAYLMKASALIPFFAMAIGFCVWMLLTGYRRSRKRAVFRGEHKDSFAHPQNDSKIRRVSSAVLLKAGMLSIACIVSFLCVNLAFGKVVEAQTVFDYNKEASFPATHFIMMGMGEPIGSYSDRDVALTRDAGDTEQKIAANIAEIKSRLEAFGLSGYAAFLAKKFEANTADGTFFFRGEGGVPQLSERNPNGLVEQTLGQLYFKDGAYFCYFRFYSQIIWVAALFFMLLSFKKQGLYVSTLQLAVLGALVFLLLFEGGRSRYLIQFLPVFSLLCSLGLGVFVKSLSVRCSGNSAPIEKPDT